jgi:hypothetical protein
MRFAPLFLALAAMVQAEVHTESDTPNAAFAAPDPSLPLTNWPQSGINTPEGYEPGTGPGCNYCTIPVGYSNLDVGAPLGVEKQFTRSWQRAHRKAKNMLDGWSLEDKVNLVTGVGWMQGRCVGNIREINDFPGFCLQVSTSGESERGEKRRRRVGLMTGLAARCALRGPRIGLPGSHQRCRDVSRRVVSKSWAPLTLLSASTSRSCTSAVKPWAPSSAVKGSTSRWAP